MHPSYRSPEARTSQRRRRRTPRPLLPWAVKASTPSLTDEKIHLFLARRLEPARQSLESDEVLTVETVHFEETVSMAQAGRICDGKSVSALLRAAPIATTGC